MNPFDLLQDSVNLNTCRFIGDYNMLIYLVLKRKIYCVYGHALIFSLMYQKESPMLSPYVHVYTHMNIYKYGCMILCHVYSCCFLFDSTISHMSRSINVSVYNVDTLCILI